MSITDYGFIGFENAVDKFEKRFIKRIKEIVAETAEIIASQMVALAPVAEIDGGNLKRSIDVRYYNHGLTAIVTVGAEYAIYVEFGTGIYAEEGKGRKTPWVYFDTKLNRYIWTRGMSAQPFYRPSIEVGAQHFKSELNKLGA
ncbi:HK97-gp10 family putative phage morphogenesis protein [Ornithinibacillus xuwenensis]|uniref:HK97-gp10 family putative phage morphogenesis protein n=1 Tax=Ornithinibacillus xuwenensis TaxID=3144668 RepID=A0ABU9XC49_9BACI